MNTIQVTTPCGVVEGFQEDGVNCFLGIPYATAKRFEYPQTYYVDLSKKLWQVKNDLLAGCRVE